MTLSPSQSFKSFRGNIDDNAKPTSGSTGVLLGRCLGCGKSTASKIFAITAIIIISIIVYIRLSMNIGYIYPERVGLSVVAGKWLEDPQHLTRHWLALQAQQQANNRPTALSSDFDAFNTSSGTNIWDVFPPTVNCPDMQRLGPTGEGGKWVCGLAHLQSLPFCIMYSFGISTDVSFEVEILQRTRCLIFAFDPTIGRLPYHLLPASQQASLNASMRSRIVFNKMALGVSSGSTVEHSLTEQLYDTMARYGHSMIHLLKVDVEGSEWDAFHQLSTLKHTLQHGLPVGQLLIELHHRRSDETSAFFREMHSMGMLPFSREINLIPCLSGGKPFAVEYSFISVRSYFGHELRPEVPAGVTADWHMPLRAAIYFLTMRSHTDRLQGALKSLYDAFWKDYPYPVIVFHDDLSAEDMLRIQQAVPAMRIRFLVLSFAIPTTLLQRNVSIPDRTVCDPQFSTIGYRHMCRFHAFGVHEALAKHGFEYDYLLRLDDDSHFHHPIGYDMFRYMAVNEKLYGFVSTVNDNKDCVRGLWESARAFAGRVDVQLANDSFFHAWPDPLVFYNNFEISHASLWQSDTWKKFVDHVEGTGGIYTQRWGDAPLHTIGVSMLLNRQQVHAFSDIAYRHPPFVDQGARGLPMPDADPFGLHSAHCTFYDRWICPNGTDGNYTTNASRTAHVIKWKTSRSAGSKGLVLNQLDYDAAANTQQGVIFTFAHGGREDSISNTVDSLFANYALAFPTPFVVFYSAQGGFASSKVQHALQTGNASDLRPLMRFIPVVLPDLSKHTLHPNCSCKGTEEQAATIFLRYQVYALLKVEGYEWFLRVADDSRLSQPISYNIFDFMATKRKAYGFVQILDGDVSCQQAAWAMGQELCAKMDKQPGKASCSALFQQWAQRMLFMTSFEVSHASVWESSIAQALFTAIGDIPGSPLATVQRSVSNNWMDSVLHTLVVVMSLDSQQLIQLDEVHYQIIWNKASLSATPGVIDRSAYRSRSFPELDGWFAPQRVGWLGGDVATSVSLPARHPGDATQLVWLFGDSVLGVSSANRRIAEHSSIVANTVAVSTVASESNRSVRSLRGLRYHWRTASDGSPAAIFELNDTSVCLGKERSPALWPIAGIAVTGSVPSDTRLVVLCQVSCGSAADTPGQSMPNNVLSFAAESTAIVVVKNPYDAPDIWEYDHLVLPESNSTLYRWMAFSQAQGLRFAGIKDEVYLLGSYLPDMRSSVSAATGFQVIARISAAALVALDLTSLEVATSESMWQKLFPNALTSQAAVTPLHLFSSPITEASLVYSSSALHQWMVLSLHMMSQHLQLCSASAVTGPWSCKYVAEVPSSSQGLITYAAKAHPELSAGQALVVSFVSNTLRPQDLFQSEYMHAYTPKFVVLEQTL